MRSSTRGTSTRVNTQSSATQPWSPNNYFFIEKMSFEYGPENMKLETPTWTIRLNNMAADMFEEAYHVGCACACLDPGSISVRG